MEDNAYVDGVATSVDERGIARLSLYRPERKNAINGGAARRIREAMAQWSADESIRAVIIDGVGGSFSTGADVMELSGASAELGGSLDAQAAHSVIAGGSELARAIREVPVPVIASVDGAAAGIGASVALGADLIYATERSYFLMAFINIGLMPDGAASMLLTSSVGRVRANTMALLGEKLGAAEAFDAGLISSVVADREALDAAVEAAAAKLASTSVTALRLTKATLDAESMTGFEAAIERELTGQTELLQSKEFQALMTAFTGKR